MKKNPWSFEINYDAAIAEDEAIIAMAEFCLANGFTNEGAEAFYAGRFSATSHSPFYLVMCSSRHRKALGLSVHDAADLADYEIDDPDHYARVSALFDEPLPAPLPGTISDRCPGAGHNVYVRGRLVRDVILDTCRGRFLDNEADLRARLKKAKAALSRHKRNKLKYGKAS